MGEGGIKMYLEFRDFSSEFPERKTKTFSVINKRTKEELGEIKWNSRWRKESIVIFQANVFIARCVYKKS